ncbi:hypothetical protein C8Q74DRAFT_1320046 [Fomes fomentarius]|nr:hypothetical protein C8Q74DRAFT_1320046 [Fomes fomentarius]
MPSRIILVIRGTGAQGGYVVDALLKPAADEYLSLYVVRILTRDASSPRAQVLVEKGVEVVEGTIHDFPSVLAALECVYGVYVNTDGVGTFQHYVWSGLDYTYKKGGYNRSYRSSRRDGKVRERNCMRSQRSTVSDTDGSWIVLTAALYMDMPLLRPVNKRADGTYPHLNGYPADIGLFARYIFDHREVTSGQELEIASDIVDWPCLVSTFTRSRAKLSIDEWVDLWDLDRPFAKEGARFGGSFGLATFIDMLMQRDYEWIRRMNRDRYTLERMRDTGYTGELGVAPIKRAQEGGMPRLDPDRVSQL